MMDLGKPSTRHLAEVLCHCDADPAGHRLDLPGCATAFRPGRYDRPQARDLAEAEPAVAAAHKALRTHGRCTAQLDDGTRCANRIGAKVYPHPYCGVHW